jgi:probable HAF family extracellular repeat protein
MGILNPAGIFARVSTRTRYDPWLLAVALACAGLLSAVMPGLAEAAGRYLITNLGTLASYRSLAYDINDSSCVVGKLADASNTTVNGFFWSRHSGMSQLSGLGGKTAAWGINNSGQIAGVSNNLAVLWNNAGATPQPLGNLGGSTSFAFRIFNDGQIVGWADKPAYGGATVYHAFLYEHGSMTDIGTLAADQNYYYGGYSLAYYANSSGRVVGVASTSNWDYHAFVWDQTHGITDLGTNPNHPEQEGYASVIDETGNLIAGCAKDTNGNSYPMIWRNGSTAPELVPTLPASPYAEFYDVNNAGQLVGMMWDNANHQHAFVYDVDQGFQNLNGLLPANSGWELIFARSINASGQIVGLGKFNGEDRAFLLTPVGAIPSVILLLSGDFGAPAT